MGDSSAPPLKPMKLIGLTAWVLVIVYAVGVERGVSLFAITRALVAWSARSAIFHGLCTLGVAMLGPLLFALKRRGRARYGALEITFATTIVWYALGQEAAPEEAVFAELLGACYVFVRGLENVVEGRRP